MFKGPGSFGVFGRIGGLLFHLFPFGLRVVQDGLRLEHKTFLQLGSRADPLRALGVRVLAEIEVLKPLMNPRKEDQHVLLV